MKRSGVWVVAAVLATGLSLGAGAARACFTCGNFNLCNWVPTVGASWCYGTGSACVQTGRCSGFGGRDAFGAKPVVLLVTLHEDDARDRPITGASGGRKLRSSAEPGTLDEARRLAAEAVARPGAGARVVSGRFIVGVGGFRLAFRSPRGTGYALRADSEAGGVRVTLRELQPGGGARATARETLGKSDALVARVRLDGRPYIAVVRAFELEGDDATLARRLAELQHPFYDELSALPEGPDARFEAVATDD